MVSLRIKRSPKVIAGAAVLGLIAAGGAFAYWTADGSGTGSATTGNTVALKIVQDPITTYLTPGVTVDLTGTVSNPGTSTVQFKTVLAELGTIEPASGLTCDASNYVVDSSALWVSNIPLDGAAAPVGINLTSSIWQGATLHMVSKPLVNQDGCKGAKVNIVYSVVQ